MANRRYNLNGSAGLSMPASITAFGVRHRRGSAAQAAEYRRPVYCSRWVSVIIRPSIGRHS
jgi:hypothetical protein